MPIIRVWAETLFCAMAQGRQLSKPHPLRLSFAWLGVLFVSDSSSNRGNYSSDRCQASNLLTLARPHLARQWRCTTRGLLQFRLCSVVSMICRRWHCDLPNWTSRSMRVLSILSHSFASPSPTPHCIVGCLFSRFTNHASCILEAAVFFAVCSERLLIWHARRPESLPDVPSVVAACCISFLHFPFFVLLFPIVCSHLWFHSESSLLGINAVISVLESVSQADLKFSWLLFIFISNLTICIHFLPSFFMPLDNESAIYMTMLLFLGCLVWGAFNRKTTNARCQRWPHVPVHWVEIGQCIPEGITSAWVVDHKWNACTPQLLHWPFLPSSILHFCVVLSSGVITCTRNLRWVQVWWIRSERPLRLRCLAL